jgi:hypothetical protein
MEQQKPLDVFKPALDELKSSGKSVWGPRPFNAYLAEHDISTSGRKTPEFISIDSLDRLDRCLREAGVMVLRLGRAHAPGGGAGTAFALVQLGPKLGDLFLSDQMLIKDVNPETFLPTATVRDLYPFHLLPQLSEPNVLSYAFASGMLAEALSLDARGPMTPPARGSSNLSFSFRTHPAISEVLNHDQGRVEIDAMFVSQRNGHPCLFILEAKIDSSVTLAKHKLAYPVLGLARSVPHEMEIIPVYARFSTSSSGLHALIAECRFSGGVRPGHPPAVLADLVAHRIRLLTIPKHIAVGFAGAQNAALAPANKV